MRCGASKGRPGAGASGFGNLGARVDVQDPDYVNFRIVGFVMINPFLGTEATTADFRAWRTANNKGGDFRVLSDVRRIVLPVPDTFDVQ